MAENNDRTTGPIAAQAALDGIKRACEANNPAAMVPVLVALLENPVALAELANVASGENPY